MHKFLFPFKSYLPLQTSPLLRRHYHEGIKNKVYLVCLTGGPCAGKTTALASIMTHFSSKFTV